MPADFEAAAERLARALPADAWIPDEELQRYTVQGRRPTVGVRPANEDEAAAAMRLAAADGWCVVPWGRGTAQQRGTPPAQYDLCLSLERMNAVLEHAPEDMVATVQAGARLEDLQAALAGTGQWWPLDPPGAGATVGGIVATNRSGPRRLLYGTARDTVLGMRVLHADGVVTKHGGKVVKNVAGYDLNKLHIGALGTLGVILEVSLKVRPVPQLETIVAAPFETIAAAAGALQRIAGSELMPTALELLNDRAASEVLPDATGPASAVVAVEGPPTAIERQVKQVSGVLAATGGGQPNVFDRNDVTRIWKGMRDLGSGGRAPVILWCTLAVLPANGAGVAQAAADIAQQFSQRALINGHAGNGVLRLGLAGHPEPLLAERAVNAWRELAMRHGGTLVVDAAPDNWRGRLDIWGPPRRDFFLMQRLKRALDPNGLLNRGRFVGGM